MEKQLSAKEKAEALRDILLALLAYGLIVIGFPIIIVLLAR